MSNGGVDKVIIANGAALSAKYGAVGAPQIGVALAALVAADQARGLASRVVHIDDAAEMAAFNGRPVAAAADEAGAKAAVDAIYAALTPAYLLLLDGPDVIPHIALDRLDGVGDHDANIPSDLPYACSAPFSRNAKDFVAIDRVVGRLPAAAGERDPAYLANVVNRAIAHAPQQKSVYANYFGVGAYDWGPPTQLSLAAAFGQNGDVLLSPPAASPGIDAKLGRASHFINCHGMSSDPQFIGQEGAQYPIAFDSGSVASRLGGQSGVVTAECCFGAELYNYRAKRLAEPICVAYLGSGAIAFVGSTNTAYGAADASSSQADLLCQYFWHAIFAGASTGRALLQARQDFIRSQEMSNDANVKTIAQFLLLGDPSLVPVAASAVAEINPATASPAEFNAAAKASDLVAAKSIDAGAEHAQRKRRREALASLGRALGQAASRSGRRLKENGAAIQRLRQLAASRGFGEPIVLEVTGGAEFRRSVRALKQKRRVVTAFKQGERIFSAGAPPTPFFRVLVATVVDDSVISVSECESR